LLDVDVASLKWALLGLS